MDKSKPTIIVSCGTRPDVIKMWPVYCSLRLRSDCNVLLCHSGQHRDMADQVYTVFGIKPDWQIYHTEGGLAECSLASLTGELLEGFHKIYKHVKPDFVLAHGDTVTGLVSALAAFYLKIPVGHVEAGLRTSRFEAPHPEEGIRRMISRITSLHFAPTTQAARNLYNESVSGKVYVTGNTVVDSLQYILKQGTPIELVETYSNKKLILVTCHRRESWGVPLRQLCANIKKLADTDSNNVVLWPVHANPNVAEIVHSELQDYPGVVLQDALSYNTFVHLLARANLVLTDSGGVVEEAAVLGKPTLVMRNEIERPEALELPEIRLVGYDFDEMITIAKRWLKSPPKGQGTNAFGDGTAGAEIASLVLNYVNRGLKNESSK